MKFSYIEQLCQFFGLQGSWPWVWVSRVNWGPCWNCNRYLLMLAGPDGLLPVQPPGNSWGHPGNIPTVRWIPEGQEQGHLCVGRCAGRGGAGRGLPQDAPQGDGLNCNLIARQKYITKWCAVQTSANLANYLMWPSDCIMCVFVLCNVMYFAKWFTPAYVDGSCTMQRLFCQLFLTAVELYICCIIQCLFCPICMTAIDLRVYMFTLLADASSTVGGWMSRWWSSGWQQEGTPPFI